MNKEEIYSMVPKSKFDTSLVDQLRKISKEEIKLIIPELIFWISDANWPVARPIADILLEYPDLIQPYLEEHLSEHEVDDELKYNIIILILPNLPVNIQNELVKFIERICINPTKDEANGSLEVAQDYLDEYKLKYKK